MWPPLLQTQRSPLVRGVALGDGIGGDQPERSAEPDQIEGASKEVGDNVALAGALSVSYTQPVCVAGKVGANDVDVASERRLPTMASKPGLPGQRLRGNSICQ